MDGALNIVDGILYTYFFNQTRYQIFYHDDIAEQHGGGGRSRWLNNNQSGKQEKRLLHRRLHLHHNLQPTFQNANTDQHSDRKIAWHNEIGSLKVRH
jgi:hypothetical protein